MKFSEIWLREWVNPAIDSNSLGEKITMSGLEVNSIEPVSGDFHGVVVGKVIQCQQHPNAPKFCITKVDIGEKHLLDIVCGAPNCRTNLCVVVAIIGALLPGYLKIKATKLFGKLSEGLLCSFSELGISEYYSGSGIIELPPDAPVGRDIREYLQLNDNIIDISVTPNRADCLCLLGIARDVAVCHRMDLNIPGIEPVVPLVNDTLPIQVNAQEACPCYLTRVIKNINIGATTPLWMKEKLRRCGLRLVDTVVDITNYVLLELGQPMHVFDLDRIDSGILVRQARQDETITLLDGSGEINLSSDTLVIADQSKVLAIAGILDGAASSISASTSNIILNCAYFNPLAIQDSTRRYGLHTDASHRYERGVDSALQNKAMERATVLLMTICGGKPGPVINVTTASNLKQPVTIELRRKTLDRLIGYPISDHEVNDILIRLGCQVSITKEGWHALTPSWRFDMAIEEDLIEEVARVYGYEAIPNIPLRTNLEMLHHREAALTLARVKMLLVDRGYQEAITYSFVDPKMQALLYPNTAPLLLPRPISQKMSAMRLSLWVGLLDAVVYNQNRQQHRIRLFESGLRFMPDNSANLGIRQELMLAGVITGLLFNEHWDLVRRPVDFYDAKGDLEAIFELTGKLDNIEFKAQHNLALHPGQSAAIYLKDELIGFLGLINPKIESQLNLNGRTLVFELLWDKVSERKIPQANNISCFPSNRRDIAVVVAANIAAADIIKECKRVVANQLVEINLFDVYQGKGVAEGFKSLAISLILQDTTCTLKEEEIAAIVAKCVAALKQRFQASLRDESYGAY